MRGEDINRGHEIEKALLAEECCPEDKVEELKKEIILIVSVMRKDPQMEWVTVHLRASKETWICKNISV